MLKNQGIISLIVLDPYKKILGDMYSPSWIFRKITTYEGVQIENGKDLNNFRNYYLEGSRYTIYSYRTRSFLSLKKKVKSKSTLTFRIFRFF